MARSQTFTPIQTMTAASSGTSDVQPIAVPNETNAVLISAETNDLRLTFDGTSPAGGLGSHVIYKASAPQFFPISPKGGVIRFVSTAAAPAAIEVTCLS